VLTLSLVVRKVSLIAISPNVRRLLIKVLEVFEAFQQTAYGIFYAPTCKTDCLQILCKFCKNWISIPNIVHQLTLSLCCKYCKIHSHSNFPDAINSIRRLAASDCKPMTSVFYDVIRLESIRRRSNVLIEGHFYGFFVWKFEPHNVVCHRVDPKKALPYVTTRFEPSRVKSMHGLLQ